MKSKNYRSNGAKGFWIIIAHIAAIVAAACAVVSIVMYDAGIVLWDENKSYEQSERFSYQFRNYGLDVINGLVLQENYDKLENAPSSAVIDLEEFSRSGSSEYALGEISYENNWGLAYSVKDLMEWAQEWSGRYYNTTEASPVVECMDEAGNTYYFYYDDFKERALDGEIKLEPSSYTYGDGEEITTEDLLNDFYRGYSDVIETAEDTKTGAVYNNISLSSVTPIEEKFAPEGAENLLEVLNTNSYWNGRLDEAYEGLDSLLSFLSAYTQDSGNYFAQNLSEGETNLTYLYADRETKSVSTNKEAYASYENLDASLKEIQENGAYTIIYPDISDSSTNLEYIERDAVLQLWNHTIKSGLGTQDFVFAVGVDTSFPVADTMGTQANTYETYRSYVVYVAIGGVVSVVLLLVSLVWLTVAAGRRPGDEEVHLNAFDHWFTEIAAAVIVGIWGGAVMAFGFSLNHLEISDLAEVFVFSTVTAGFTMILFLTGYLSLVRRIKAKTLWKNSLLRYLLRLCKKVLKKFGSFMEIYSKNTASKIKMTVISIVFLGLQFLFCGIIFTGGAAFLLLLAFIDIGALVYVIRKAGGRDILLEGLKRISGGELQYKIPLEKLDGEQKTMAEYINNIGSGLDAAVEKSVKNERMKTELITNVSHDLKTPLTSIINYVDLLKRENFTDEKIQGYLNILDEKSQRLKVLTEDVVEASKASSGNINLEMNDIDFVEMIQQVIGEFEERFQKRNLVMMVHFTDEPSVIYADGQRMWRVLENIFSNVVKYAMEGTRVYAEVTNADKKITFSLKNISAQPLNISPDELTERFIRGDVSRNTEGSGLGLSIAKSLTELQGGEFKLYLDGDLFKVMITFAAKAKGTQNKSEPGKTKDSI